MRRAPGVASIGFLGGSPLQLAADRPPVVLVARPEGGLDAGAPPMIGRSLQSPAGLIPVYVSEPAMWIYGWKAGDRIALPVGAADLE